MHYRVLCLSILIACLPVSAFAASDPSFVSDPGAAYQYYRDKGIQALNNGEYEQADRYFQMAASVASSNDNQRNISELRYQANVPGYNAGAVVVVAPEKKSAQPAQSEQSAVMSAPQPKGVAAPPATTSIGPVSLDELAALPKPTVRIEIGSELIVEGKSIDRFLIVDEGFISAKVLDSHQLRITALKRGNTFIHIWSGGGRITIYVQVVFPHNAPTEELFKPGPTSHAQPFRFSYSNDWGTYYTGNNIGNLERSSLDMQQIYALEGETPYGYMDTSMNVSKFNGPSEVLTYTLGMSDVPVPGTQDVDVRIFDAARYLSPLTMPGTRLRGVFADVDLLDDTIGLSFSHGQKLSTFGFISQGNNLNRRSYVDAYRITLFPHDVRHQYALNYARGYGSQHENYLAQEVFSAQTRHKLNDVATVGGEYGQQSSHGAGLAGIKLENNNVGTALNFRDISKKYTTISSYPANQGEIGAIWSTYADFERWSSNSSVDIYRDRLYFNPDNSEALNLDANAHVNFNLTRYLSNEASVYYVDAAGELSPRRNLSIDDRFSRYIDIWGNRKMTVYAGGTYQQNRYGEESNEFDRYSLLGGLRVPLTDTVAIFGNYEYYWVHERQTNLDSNPNVVNTGVSYNKQLNDRVSVHSDLTYRAESGVGPSSSVLSGEDSAGVGMGVYYTPKTDMSVFADSRLRRVWSRANNDPSYNDLDLRLGMRMAFDVLPGWDPTGTVAGIVFRDRDGDGKFNGKDQGLENVTVKIGEKETKTDGQGHYRMKISGKSVMVTPMLESVPTGLIFSTPTFLTVPIKQSRTVKVDFGLISQTGVYGIVFLDKNGNGKPDNGDKFISRARILIDGKGSQVTDSQGSYSFKNVTPGEHTLSIDLSSIAIDMLPAIKLKNSINVAEGSTYIFHVPLKSK